jgi:hypothetical protein
VEGVLVVHHHNHPHVLLLQIGNTFFKLYVFFFFLNCTFLYRLIELGDLLTLMHQTRWAIAARRRRDWGTEAQVDSQARAQLSESAGLGGMSAHIDPMSCVKLKQLLQIGELLCIWWRPNFETMQVSHHASFWRSRFPIHCRSIHTSLRTSLNRKSARSCLWFSFLRHVRPPIHHSFLFYVCVFVCIFFSPFF